MPLPDLSYSEAGPIESWIVVARGGDPVLGAGLSASAECSTEDQARAIAQQFLDLGVPPECVEVRHTVTRWARMDGGL